MDVRAALALLEQLEEGMKGLQFIASASRRKINSSFALLAVQALQKYLGGEVEQAQADFATLADELKARQQFRTMQSAGQP